MDYAKDVFDFLKNQMGTENTSPIQHLDMLKINKEMLNQEKAKEFQWMARELSSFRNMPWAFFVNTSNGIHTGFFVVTTETHNNIRTTINNNDIVSNTHTNEQLKSIKKLELSFVEFLSEMDPQNKYTIYFIGI